jgi:hypothetical protein
MECKVMNKMMMFYMNIQMLKYRFYFSETVALYPFDVRLFGGFD